MPPSILALAFATFAIGTTEFVIMGILPELAASLGVSIPSAGLLVSGYAIGVAIGAPLLAVLTSRMSRKAALLLLMAVFVVGNAMCALAPGYATLMAARVLTSFAHGSFFGIGSVVAASLVAPERRGSAVALMFAGLALANVLGVPLGTWIGHTLGWRATFWAVTGAGLLGVAALVLLVPAQRGSGTLDLRSEVRVLARPQVWLALLTTVLGFGGVFIVFTYIAPILQQMSGFAPASVTLLLVLFGVGLVIGNKFGGKFADGAELKALLAIFLALGGIMVLFAYTMHTRTGSAITLFFWGIAAFATVPALQTRVLSQTASAPNLAATLNIGAFNVGNALGAWLGGRMLTLGYALDALPWASALATLAATGAVVLAMRMDARRRSGEQAFGALGSP